MEKFPEITFVSKKIAGADGEWKVTGDLTIHGVTKQVTLDVEGPAPEVKDPWGNVKSGASAATKISRKDFGMVLNVALETGGVMVGDEVDDHAGTGTAAELTALRPSPPSFPACLRA